MNNEPTEAMEAICSCYPLDQPENEYNLTIKVQADGGGRVHCDECGRPMSPVGMSRTEYLTGRPTPAHVPAEGLVEPLILRMAKAMHRISGSPFAWGDIPDQDEGYIKFAQAAWGEAATEMLDGAEALAALSISNTPAISGLADELFGKEIRKAHKLLLLVESERGRMDAEDERLNPYCDDGPGGDDTINRCFDAGLLVQQGSEDVFTCELTDKGRAALRSTPSADGMREAVVQALAVIEAAPELNMSNYTAEEVEALNNATVEAWQILNLALRNEGTAEPPK